MAPRANDALRDASDGRVLLGGKDHEERYFPEKGARAPDLACTNCVAEKNMGRVVRVTNGVPQGPVLDLGVNFMSERGLLGIALHPDFPTVPQVFLFWTARSTGPPANPFFPDERTSLLSNMLAPDTEDTLSNRVALTPRPERPI